MRTRSSTRSRTRTSLYGLLLGLLLGAGLLPVTAATAADNGTWGSSRRRRPGPR
ncbi:hypothetical protein WKI68_28865 [Streptomyces sp. MS1.HAVA.3]|uniref:Uncharacterized protein n=1 Tax=Streptomyces caledonius TaxID=3134107 RepID=A0ABU8UAT3_9ACTN